MPTPSSLGIRARNKVTPRALYNRFQEAKMSVRKRRAKENKMEEKMIRSMDDLTEFEEFREAVLPALRKDLAAGMSAEEIQKKYAAYAAARTVSIATTSQDDQKALAAARDIQDRALGKAVERKKITHEMENAPEEELDAYLLSKLDDMEDERKQKAH